MSEVVEAVVISGPRRGEIVTVDLDQVETVSEEAFSQLSDAIRELDNAVLGVLEETRALRSELRAAAESLTANGQRVGDSPADRVVDSARR